MIQHFCQELQLLHVKAKFQSTENVKNVQNLFKDSRNIKRNQMK